MRDTPINQKLNLSFVLSGLNEGIPPPQVIVRNYHRANHPAPGFISFLKDPKNRWNFLESRSQRGSSEPCGFRHQGHHLY